MITDYLNDRITIDLEDFIKIFLKKWKMVGVITIAFAILFAGVSYAFGEEISAPASEEYLFWEDNLENVTNYRKYSILMQLDPLEIYQETIFVDQITDKAMLKNYVLSSDIWNDIETDYSTMYARELISWVESEETGKVEINLRHATKDDAVEWMQYLKEKILAYDSNVQMIDGASAVVTDDTALERQQNKYIDIEFAEQLLAESQGPYTIEVRMEVAAIVGAVTGMIFSGVLIVLGLMFKKR